MFNLTLICVHNERNTRRKFTSGEKIRIALEGFGDFTSAAGGPITTCTVGRILRGIGVDGYANEMAKTNK